MSYETLRDYGFDSDPEYQAGLSSILAQVPTSLSIPEKEAVILDAKCFYITRKFDINPPLDSSQYQTWLQSNTPANANVSASNITRETTAQPSTSSTQAADAQPSSHVPVITNTDARDPAPPPQPVYPPSFAELVELIVQNKTIPGIEEIPDTVISDPSLAMTEDSTATDAASVNNRSRRKPWENQISTETDAQTEGVQQPSESVNLPNQGST